MNQLPQISEAEFEVMKIIWKYAPINTNDITDRLVQTTDWSPKTIHTMLKRLSDKGAITYEKCGRMFVYTPAVTRQEYVNGKSASFIRRYFNGSIKNLLSAYLEEDAVSQEEIDSLRRLLDASAKKDCEKE